MDDLNKVIKNRYQDRYDNFTYFQIDIEAKSDIKISDVRNYILDNDCKIELYYIDIKIELDDFEEPIKPFLNEIFLQLDPDLHLRMNTFFMNSYFGSLNDLIFPTKTGQKMINLFSRTEQYFLHRGENVEEESFAKIYIRADTRRMEVKRKYQTLLEFFADSFSFWEDLFLIFNIIFNAYNRICLIYSLESRLFFFDRKENKNYNISQYSEKIRKIIAAIEDNPELKPYLKKNSDNKYKKNNIINSNNKFKLNIYNIFSDDLYNNNKKNKNNDETFLAKMNDITVTNNETSFVDDKIVNRMMNKKQLNKNNSRISIFFLNLFDYLNFFECKRCECTKCKNREILYFHGEDFINSKLDITHYLKNIILFDILKDMIKKNIYLIFYLCRLYLQKKAMDLIINIIKVMSKMTLSVWLVKFQVCWKI